MTRQYQLKSLSRVRGYQTIEVDQGLESFLIGSYQGEPHLLVGLDGASAWVRRYTVKQSPRRRRLHVYFSSSEIGVPTIEMLDRMHLLDRFGTAVNCRFVRVPDMPVTEGGEIDRQKLMAMVGDAHSWADEYEPPQTELQQGISRIWSDILGSQKVDLRDSFFELGGHSLGAIQVISRIKKIFGVDVPVGQLFSAPTLKQLADFVQDKLIEQIEQISDYEANRLLDEQARTTNGQNSD